MVKIIIINTSDNTAIAALRLHKALLEKKVDSKMLVRIKDANNKGVVELKVNRREEDIAEEDIIEMIRQGYINNNRKPFSNTLFSLSYPGYDISTHPAVVGADIINLHWVSYFLSPESFKALVGLGKPIVWTLHDQWAFTGGCHYSTGCDSFKKDCMECDQLAEDPFHIPYHNLKQRLDALKDANLTIVTPSKWLAGLAKKSALFKNRRIEVIKNSLDINKYKPLDKTAIRAKLGISEDIKVILFGSGLYKEKRKGFAELIDVLKIAQRDRRVKQLINKDKVLLLCFGDNSENDFSSIKIPVKSLGFIKAENEIVAAYNAADFLIFPSLEDNLPNMMLEAMACGIPVTAFGTGGMKDLLAESKGGKLVPAFKLEQMAQAVIEFLGDDKLLQKASIKAREYAENSLAFSNQSSSYINLFKELLKEKKGRAVKKGSTKSNASLYCSMSDINMYPLYNEYSKKYIVELNRRSEEKLRLAYNSFTYKLGKFFLSPLKMIMGKNNKN